jgi:hypothetical protein
MKNKKNKIEETKLVAWNDTNFDIENLNLKEITKEELEDKRIKSYNYIIK